MLNRLTNSQRSLQKGNDSSHSFFSCQSNKSLQNIRVKSAKSITRSPQNIVRELPDFGSEIVFELTSILGRRNKNEDAHTQFKYKNMLVVGLFDGHNGEKVSQICAAQLQKLFITYYEKESSSGQHIFFDRLLQKIVAKLQETVAGYMDLNECGTTSLIIVINRADDTVHVSNIGDSRMLIGYNDNTFKETKDHKPLTDKERIEKAGGKIVEVDGVWRVNQVLAVARSIGDKYMKQYVTCDMDYYQFSLDNAAYILLGCDGLFDEFSSQEVHDLLMQVHNKKVVDKRLYDELNGKKDINNELNKETQKTKKLFENVDLKQNTAKKVTQALTKMAYMKGSTDNISIYLSFIDTFKTPIDQLKNEIQEESSVQSIIDE